MILVIGEILIDLIGKDNDDGIDLTARLGGAPFNVASNLSFLDVPTTFYGVVGEDIFGEYILKEAKKSYKLNLFLQLFMELLVKIYLENIFLKKLKSHIN